MYRSLGSNHFVVVVSATLNHRLWSRSLSVVEVADPAKGLIKYTEEEFESQWATTVIDGERRGVALLLEPTAAFYENDTFAEKSSSAFLGINNYNLTHSHPSHVFFLLVAQ
jgi:ATP-binding cassette, subfamily B, bacterial